MGTGLPGGAAARWLVGVAGVYGAVQLAVVGRLGLGWDETVYVSQVSRAVPAAYFSAPRARGISWIAAPVASLTTDAWAVRVYLAVASSVALAVAFWPWLRLHRGGVVPLAAGTFAVLWPALFYGPQAMPNLWVAFAAVAATGWFLRSVADRRPWAPRVAVAVAVAVAALVRPSDSAFLAGGLFAAAVLVPAWRDVRLAGAVLAGVAAGWLPWLVEALTSYGGVLARLHAASATEGGTTPQLSIVTALRSVDGPALCRPCTHPVPLAGTLLWVGGLLAVSAAVVAAVRARRAGPTVLATVIGFTMAVPYLFLVGYSAPRFLLAAYALLVLPVAEALTALWRARPRVVSPRLAKSAVGVLLLGLAAYQLTLLVVHVRSSERQRVAWTRLAAALGSAGVRPPCTLSGTEAPPIAFYAGCASAQTTGHDRSVTAQALAARAAREPVAYLDLSGAPPPRWASGWRTVVVVTPYGRWDVRISPAGPPLQAHG